MRKRIIKIGIMPKEQFRKRTIDIAAGRYTPKQGEPKIWFHSFKAMGEVLNEKNMELIRIIFDQNPETLTELAELSNRQLSNVSRTIKTLHAHKLVDLKKEGNATIPVAKTKDFNAQNYEYAH